MVLEQLLGLATLFFQLLELAIIEHKGLQP
jgi:hypothetical protein